jgi:Carboxypeptidase regulatory-like domain
MKIAAICFFLLSSVAFAGTPALEGIVKDAGGHPIKGADVKIEARAGTFSKTVKTDARGHYFSDGMKLGIYYKVTLIVNGTVKASILNASARSTKPATLNFDLKKDKVAPKTHLVYVPAQTGTHIGGDRWVEVDDKGRVVDDNVNLETVRGKALKKMWESSVPRSQGSGN